MTPKTPGEIPGEVPGEIPGEIPDFDDEDGEIADRIWDDIRRERRGIAEPPGRID